MLNPPETTEPSDLHCAVVPAAITTLNGPLSLPRYCRLPMVK